MNTNTIAALYERCQYGFFLRDLPTLADRVAKLQEWTALRRLPGETSYAVHVHELGNRGGLGDTEVYVPARVAAWATANLPAKSNPHERPYCVFVWTHTDAGADSAYRYATREEFATLIRGVQAYQRKQQRRVRRLVAQLGAYHRQQELRKLRQGQWLGADKALTTAARVAEPGVSFLGDADLTPEQHRALAYWAVPEEAQMGPAFPAGTGVALKPVKRSRELVDGAVYLYHYQLAEDYPLLTLGRLDLSRKSHGMLPLLRDEAPTTAMLTWAAWSDPKFKLYRVTHYTTRAAEPVAAAQGLRLGHVQVPAEVYHQELALAA